MINFNRIAPVYDTLSKLVYGNALMNARSCFLNKLPESGIVLNIGGGSGEVLQHLLELRPGLKVDFIETSDKFIALAKRKLNPELLNRVHFIHGNENSIEAAKKYEAVITFFIVDLFPQNDAEEFCTKIISHLKSDGVWLFADFIQPKSLFQKLLLKFMYQFFRLITNIPASQLPDYDSIFQKLYMSEINLQFFYNEMISSKILKRV